jgi:hypothetical protein
MQLRLAGERVWATTDFEKIWRASGAIDTVCDFEHQEFALPVMSQFWPKGLVIAYQAWGGAVCRAPLA